MGLSSCVHGIDFKIILHLWLGKKVNSSLICWSSLTVFCFRMTVTVLTINLLDYFCWHILSVLLCYTLLAYIISVNGDAKRLLPSISRTPNSWFIAGEKKCGLYTETYGNQVWKILNFYNGKSLDKMAVICAQVQNWAYCYLILVHVSLQGVCALGEAPMYVSWYRRHLSPSVWHLQNSGSHWFLPNREESQEQNSSVFF